MTEGSRLLAGRYQVGALIGRGGMSDVHLGTDNRLGRTVAIKLLKPTLANDPAFRTRFRQEAQAAARMAHPTIVRVFDAGEETVREPGGREAQVPFIVMEHVDGRMLKDIIREGPLEPSEAVRIIEGVLTALEYSHRAGVVHRDIKPGNIMITKSGQVKVMDFGIARAISDSSATVAQTTAILGTASYFSPEQAKGESVDARTDLYSTGVVLFEMLTGRTPFRGDTPVAVAYQHVSEKPVAPSQINPRVSPALDTVVLHALAKDRFARYQSAAEFREDASAAGAGHIPVHKAKDGFQDTLFGSPTAPVSVSAAALRQLTEDETMVRVQSRPPVVWIWAGILSVVVIIVAVMFWVFSLSPSPTVPDSSRVVPEVAGMTFQKAQGMLSGQDLQWNELQEASSTVATGHVIRTDPTGRTAVSPGQTIDVYVSTGKKAVQVPDVANQDLPTAQAALQAAGFAAGAITKENSATQAANVVLRSDPVGGAQAHEGDTVNLVISSGNVTMPDVTGQSISAAESILAAPNLQLHAEPKPDATCPAEQGTLVHSQSLPPGDVPQGSTVTLTYCTG
ncbi:MAG: Stk1 family PASTA domain-containing Ser/Thr kinase [Microbacteriaceae bacterium]